MLGAKLARRIVVPLLIAVAVLFVLLGVVATRVAEARVSEELEDQADRIAATLEGLAVAPEHRPEILPALARLVDCELLVGGYATRADWPAEELQRVAAGRAVMGGDSYRVLARPVRQGSERVFLLWSEERIGTRRRDVLAPIAGAGALGLLVALALGLLVARRIARPVRDLAESVRGFAHGRFEGDVGPRGPGEIGELQEAFVRMVEEIRRGQERLRESERFAALGRLAGGIAHELRNPLTAIRMAVETATADEPESRSEARRIALSEIDRLDRTLRELLDFVRPRTPRLAPLEVRPLLEEVAHLLRPQCEHLGVRLELEAADGLVLRADRDRLKQALVNLVLNGAQAQPSGGVVRLRGRERTIEVEDEGPGIAPEVEATLFQPFVTTRSAGIGLGLAVVRQVVEEHGAEIDVRSGREGTRFTLRFGA